MRMMRSSVVQMLLVALVVGLPLGSMVRPAEAQSPGDEQWCSGLFAYLDENTRLSFNEQAASVARDGCVDYVSATGLPPAASRSDPGLDPEPSTALSSFLAFSTHVRDASATATQIAHEGQQDPTPGLVGLAKTFDRFGDWADTERVWLEANPPDQCFAMLHARWGDAVNDLGQGARKMAKGMRKADYQKAEAGTVQVYDALDRMDEVPPLLYDVECGP